VEFLSGLATNQYSVLLVTHVMLQRASVVVSSLQKTEEINFKLFNSSY
jgi:hypothetical protein